MAENVLRAEVRSGSGKGVARKLRAAGRLPAVVYGRGAAGEAVAVDPAALDRILHQSGSGMNTLIDLSLDGSTRTVLVKELQRDPVRGRYLHADFYVLDLEKEVEVAVPLHFVGKAKGVELGGVVDHPLREVEVACLPRAIPDAIEVDLSELEIGDSLHVRDLPIPADVRVLTDPELAVANVEVPAVVEEAAPAEEAEVAEAAEGAAAPAAAGAEPQKEEAGSE